MSRDARPIGVTICGAAIWRGEAIALADLPAGYQAVAYPEQAGWLVGTPEQLADAKAMLGLHFFGAPLLRPDRL